MIKKLPFKIYHPILFSIFPILSLYSNNINELNFKEIWLPAGFSILLVILFWRLFNFFLKDVYKSAIFTSLFFLLFASYSHIVGGIITPLFPNIPNRYFLLLLILITLMMGIFLSKFKKNIKQLTIIMNIFSISLLVFPLISITLKEIERAKYNLKLVPILSVNGSKINITSMPDIYYIIVDRYPSATIAMNNFYFDNSEFLNFLKDRGFKIVPNTKANYGFTTTSLAATLNMRFLDTIQTQMGSASTDSTPYLNLIENNEVVRYLKNKGYLYLHFGPEYGPTFNDKNADYNYHYWHDPFNLSEFFRKYLDQTAFNPLLNFITRITEGDVDSTEEDRLDSYNLAIDQLNKVADSAKAPGPKFVFVHSFLTHVPYVFDKDGNYLSEKKALDMDQHSLFIEQILSANKYIKQLIQKIQENSKIPPIIVLQSDEGPYPDRFRANIKTFDWRQATNEEFNQKFRILNAYYLPTVPEDKQDLPKTPINTFRVIFNLYFNENLPLLPDKSFAQVGGDRPYEFFEITEKLR